MPDAPDRREEELGNGQRYPFHTLALVLEAKG